MSRRPSLVGVGVLGALLLLAYPLAWVVNRLAVRYDPRVN
jgi:hypothetical protein